MKWEAPPPSMGFGYRRRRTEDILQLKAHPMRWAVWTEGQEYHGCNSTWFKDRQLEIAIRKDPDGLYTIWARFNPEKYPEAKLTKRACTRCGRVRWAQKDANLCKRCQGPSVRTKPPMKRLKKEAAAGGSLPSGSGATTSRGKKQSGRTSSM